MPKFINIGCRSIGSGGTNIAMFPTREGLKCVWEDECTPSSMDQPCVKYVPGTNVQEALDGRNVSMISWKEFESMLKYAKKKKMFVSEE